MIAERALEELLHLITKDFKKPTRQNTETIWKHYITSEYAHNTRNHLESTNDPNPNETMPNINPKAKGKNNINPNTIKSARKPLENTYYVEAKKKHDPTHQCFDAALWLSGTDRPSILATRFAISCT